MSPERMTFIDCCLAGEALVTDIDDFVDAWHESNDSRPLSEYLGMTREEYELWAPSPELLKPIIHARKTGKPLVEALELREFYGVAARAPSRSEAQKILRWLEEEGRIP